MYNYYKLLNIPLGSSIETVRLASAKMLAHWHRTPQKFSSITELEKALDDAQQLLNDPLKKEVYDLALLQLQLNTSKNNEYKKYGTSRRNKYVAVYQPQRAPTNNYSPGKSRPMLFQNIVYWSLAFLASMLVYTVLFFTQFTSSVVILFFFFSIIHLVISFQLVKSVYCYMQVRELVFPQPNMRRTMVWSIVLVFFAIPILGFTTLKKTNQQATHAHKHKHVEAQVTGVYGPFVNLKYTVNNKTYFTSLLYNSNYSFNLFLEFEKTIRVPLHVNSKAPFMCNWCSRGNYYLIQYPH